MVLIGCVKAVPMSFTFFVKVPTFFSAWPMAPSKPALMVFAALPLSLAAVPMDLMTAEPKLSASRPIDRKSVPTSSASSPRSSRARSASLAPAAAADVPASNWRPMSRPCCSASSALSRMRSRLPRMSPSCCIVSSRSKSIPKVSSLLSAMPSPPFCGKMGRSHYCGRPSLLHVSL